MKRTTEHSFFPSLKKREHQVNEELAGIYCALILNVRKSLQVPILLRFVSQTHCFPKSSQFLQQA